VFYSKDIDGVIKRVGSTLQFREVCTPVRFLCGLLDGSLGHLVLCHINKILIVWIMIRQEIQDLSRIIILKGGL